MRSVRCGSSVRQQTVAQLGELDAQGRASAAALARQITGRAEQCELFEERAAPTPASIEVRLDRVRLERARGFGDVWLGWMLWRALGLEKVCIEDMADGREAVAWSTMAAILTIARLCEPSSELHIAEDWYRRTALEDLLGVPAEQVNDDRLYRALDQLLRHKGVIEQHLKQRLGEPFALDYALLLYDVTSTYFEGQALGNPQAKRGHSRVHRPDCKQVCIALVVTREGIPLGYEVFDGNRVDVTTVEEIVGTMEARFGIAGRAWVMDRGMTRAANISWLQKTGRRCLVGTPKSDLKKFATQISEARDWQTVRDGVEAKLCAAPTATRRSCSCALQSVAKKKGRCTNGSSPASKRGCEDSSIESRAVASLWTAAGSSARLAGCSAGTPAARDASWRAWWTTRAPTRSCASSGPHVLSGTTGRATARACYVLRSNVSDWTPEALWHTYVQLSEAEAAFRIQKSDLSIGRSGIKGRIACRLTSSSASWRTPCGRRSSSGRSAPGLATARVRSSTSSAKSSAPMSCCRWRANRNASCASAASCAPIARRPRCWTGSGCACPSACGRLPTQRECSANFRR